MIHRPERDPSEILRKRPTTPGEADTMYGWIWRHLPGPWWARLILFAAQVLAVVAVLFVWGFQHLAPYVPFNDGTVVP